MGVSPLKPTIYNPHPSDVMENREPTGGEDRGLVPVEEFPKVGGGFFAGAGGVLQYVHERALLGTVKAVPVFNEHGANRGEGMFPTA